MLNLFFPVLSHWIYHLVCVPYTLSSNPPPWNSVLRDKIVAQPKMFCPYLLSFIFYASFSKFYHDCLGILIVKLEFLRTAKILHTRVNFTGFLAIQVLVPYNYFLKQFHLCISLKGLPGRLSFYLEFWDSSELTLKLCQSSGSVISWSSFIWNWFPLIPIWHFFYIVLFSFGVIFW